MTTSSVTPAARARTLRERFGEWFLMTAEAAGMALSGSGAVVVGVLGKFMLAVVLGAIAVGLLLRLMGRRQGARAAATPVPLWARAASLGVSAVLVALLVEATQLPVRFDQPGFATWHWALVLVALAVGYAGVLRLFRRWVR